MRKNNSDKNEINDFKKMLENLLNSIDNFYDDIEQHKISPYDNQIEMKNYLYENYDFSQPKNPEVFMEDLIRMIKNNNTTTIHPRYFGWFNPSTPLTVSISDLLVSLFNPQLATYDNSPICNEIEDYLIEYIGKLFGFKEQTVAGNFTSGGSESNLTSITLALYKAFPEYKTKGLASLYTTPIIYVSESTHKSIEKIIGIIGLGVKNIHLIDTNEDDEMNIEKLKEKILEDRRKGLYPLQVIGTFGTTNSGAIDPINEIAEICLQENIWFHVDAAYGGGVLLNKKMNKLLRGIEKADSVTFDPHKLLSMPMGTGVVLTKHKEILNKAFTIEAQYANSVNSIDQYLKSFQWSRRFIGLRLFMYLALNGEDSIHKNIDNQFQINNVLKDKLIHSGWKIGNSSPFPIICFYNENATDFATYQKIEKLINQRGHCWISCTILKNIPMLRTAITSYRTNEQDIEILMKELKIAEKQILEGEKNYDYI